MKLLIIRFSAMGDVAMLVPVVRSLAQQNPNIHITVLSRPFAHAFFNNLAPNVSFMGADLKNEYRGVKGLNALYRRLAAKNFDAVADCHGILRSHYLRMRFRLCGTRTAVINKHRKERKALTRPENKVLQQLPTSFDNYADTLRQLGIEVSPTFTTIFNDHGADFTPLANRIAPRQPGERLIGIAPFAAHKGKIYPTERLKKVVQMLLEREPHCRLFFFGAGEKEHATIATLMQNHPRCINASQLLTSLHEELTLMNHLDVMLTMDSANMHLASLAGTRVVSLWGATHPLAGFLGWGQRPDDALGIALPCRPCSIYGNKPCAHGDYPCLNISEETVVEKVMNDE